MCLLEVITWENLKMKIFRGLVRNMVFFTIFPVQEHLNKIVLWKGKIDLFKRWHKPTLIKSEQDLPSKIKLKFSYSKKLSLEA
ncbi:hypothetical protein CR513_57487, partial [Mucuna pruriens]